MFRETARLKPSGISAVNLKRVWLSKGPESYSTDLEILHGEFVKCCGKNLVFTSDDPVVNSTSNTSSCRADRIDDTMTEL